MSIEFDHSGLIDINALLAALGTDEQRLLSRLKNLEFGDADLRRFGVLGSRLNDFNHQFNALDHALLYSASASDHAPFSPELPECLRHAHSICCFPSEGARYDKQYVRNRIAIGIAQQRCGLTLDANLAVYKRYLTRLMPLLWEISNHDFTEYETSLSAILKIILFDIGIMSDTYSGIQRLQMARAIPTGTSGVFEPASISATKSLFSLAAELSMALKIRYAMVARISGHDAIEAFPLAMTDNGEPVNHPSYRIQGTPCAVTIEHGLTIYDNGVQALFPDALMASKMCIKSYAGVPLFGHTGALLGILAVFGNTPFIDRDKIARLLSIFALRVATDIERLQVEQALMESEIRFRASFNRVAVGIAHVAGDGDDADMALLRAKDLGRSDYQFFPGDMNEKIPERAALENALHSAIAGNQLLLHYQPLADLQTGKLVSLEALLRWEHPELGLIAPDRFIPIAEESGLIGAIGEWVLRQACQDMRSWLDEGITDFRVAVNVSHRQFRDAQLAEKIEDLLTEMQIDPHMLSLEITETVLMQGSASSENILRQLKLLEVDLILDDFGTGYSSLSYLKRFPFDRVKIDRSFISDIVTDQDDAAIAKTIISMAHSLGIKVVAEGVETEAQWHFLLRNRCDEMQGFFFSHPLPKAEIGVLLRDGCRLPEHIFSGARQSSRTLMLVDDEPNILTALKRLLRRDGYAILTANSGEEGLALLEDNAVDVIVSDQRMPGMMGVDFLRAAKEKYPDTVRIVLSGYTELKSVTDAVNEGAIYKFLTKPWEDSQLRGHIAEAFRRKEIEDENRRLNVEVHTANQELATANKQLGMVLKQKQQKIARDEVSLDIVREVLEHLPLPIIGLDNQAMVVFMNAASTAFLAPIGLMPGCDLAYVLPSLSESIRDIRENVTRVVEIDGAWFSVTCRSMGAQSQSRGRLITLSPCEDIT